MVRQIWNVANSRRRRRRLQSTAFHHSSKLVHQIWNIASSSRRRRQLLSANVNIPYGIKIKFCIPEVSQSFAPLVAVNIREMVQGEDEAHAQGQVGHDRREEHRELGHGCH